ncbi:MAG TPA: DUF1259 domain-containing protein [Tepidisphaeraceae bacterium]|nr:DUF1259 domain-containing protein [Tepidisphaeraceae bacterium]
MTTPRAFLLTFLIVPLALVIAAVRAADKPPAAPANPPAVAPATDSPSDEHAKKKELDPADTKALADALAAKPGVVSGKVYTLTLPRADLDTRNLTFGEIPVEAGLATTLHVWRCECGKYYIIGQYVLAEYESNDVLDSLVRGGLRVASVGPILLEEKPRLVQIRFQGEGHMPAIIKTLVDAQRWVGDNRSKPNPIKLD